MNQSKGNKQTSKKNEVKCPVPGCSITYKDKHQWYRHKRGHSQKDIAEYFESGKVPCPNCESKLKSMEVLRVHMFQHHQVLAAEYYKIMEEQPQPQLKNLTLPKNKEAQRLKTKLSPKLKKGKAKVAHDSQHHQEMESVLDQEIQPSLINNPEPTQRSSANLLTQQTQYCQQPTIKSKVSQTARSKKVATKEEIKDDSLMMSGLLNINKQQPHHNFQQTSLISSKFHLLEGFGQSQEEELFLDTPSDHDMQQVAVNQPNEMIAIRNYDTKVQKPANDKPVVQSQKASPEKALMVQEAIDEQFQLELPQIEQVHPQPFQEEEIQNDVKELSQQISKSLQQVAQKNHEQLESSEPLRKLGALLSQTNRKRACSVQMQDPTITEEEKEQVNSRLDEIQLKGKSSQEKYTYEKLYRQFFKGLQSISNLKSTADHLYIEQDKIDKVSKQTTYKTRSRINLVYDSQVKESDSSLTFGELTPQAITDVCKHLGINGTSSSATFVDIGCGFGNVVFQVALNYNIRCLGIEIAKQRVLEATNYKEEFIKQNDLQLAFIEKLNKTEFIHKDIKNMDSLELSDGTPITHLYAFDARMADQDIQQIANLINKSPSLQTFAWTTTLINTIRKFNVVGFKLHQQLKCSMKSTCSQSFTFYVFKRKKKSLGIKGNNTLQAKTSIQTGFSHLSKRKSPGINIGEAAALPIIISSDTRIQTQTPQHKLQMTKLQQSQQLKPRELKAENKAMKEVDSRRTTEQQIKQMKELAYAIFSAFKKNTKVGLDELYNKYILQKLNCQAFISTNHVLSHLYKLQGIACNWYQILTPPQQQVFIKEKAHVDDMSLVYKHIKDNFNISESSTESLDKLLKIAGNKDQLIQELVSQNQNEKGGEYYIEKLYKQIRLQYPGIQPYNQNQIPDVEMHSVSTEEHMKKIIDSRIDLSAEDQLLVKEQYKIINDRKLNNEFHVDQLYQIFQRAITKQDKHMKCKKELNEVERELDNLYSSNIASLGYKILKRICKSGQSRIYQCCKVTDKKASTIYALKIPIGSSKIQNELNAINKIQQSNSSNKKFVVSIDDYKNFLGSLCIIMPWYKYNLQSLVTEVNLNEKQVFYICYYIILGMLAGHELNICHRDLKPQNIMLDEKYIPKICDWGLTDSNVYSGTHYYKAPEQHNRAPGVNIDAKKIDSWNLGLVIYYIIQRRLPYTIDDYQDFIKGERELVMDDCLSEEYLGLWNIVKQLLAFDVQKRLSIHQAAKSDIFKRMTKVNIKDLNIKNLR